MLIEIHLAITAAAFLFMVLSFIPLGEKRKTMRRTEGEEIKEESQSFVVIFPWIAMGLFYLLAISSLNIILVDCGLTTGDVWSCNEQQYVDEPLAWMFSGLGTLMLAYSILSTFLWSAGTLVGEVSKLSGGKVK